MALLGKGFGLFGRKKKGKDVRPVKIPIPCVQVRFDIDKCDDSFSYGSDCCNRLLNAVSPEQLENTIIFTGDSDKTLAGLENVFIIAIASNNEDKLKRIESLLKQSSDLIAHCSMPAIQLLNCSCEPLILSGNIRNGLMENGQDSQMAWALKKRKKA